jgi:hypothetical protein
MGKAQEVVRTDVRIPVDDHAALLQLLEPVRCSLNCAIVAVVQAIARGELVIERVKPTHPYVVKRPTFRDLETGKIRLVS